MVINPCFPQIDDRVQGSSPILIRDRITSDKVPLLRCVGSEDIGLFGSAQAVLRPCKHRIALIESTLTVWDRLIFLGQERSLYSWLFFLPSYMRLYHAVNPLAVLCSSVRYSLHTVYTRYATKAYFLDSLQAYMSAVASLLCNVLDGTTTHHTAPGTIVYQLAHTTTSTGLDHLMA